MAYFNENRELINEKEALEKKREQIIETIDNLDLPDRLATELYETVYVTFDNYLQEVDIEIERLETEDREFHRKLELEWHRERIKGLSQDASQSDP